MLITILATVVVLGVLIFVHELGHFLTAKLVDIEVPRFSIGLGPKMLGFRRGETEYVISWLPLGGYVKMAGMEEMESIEGRRSDGDRGGRSDRTGIAGASDVGLLAETEPRRVPGPRDFESKSLPARTLVISAGVLMNALFAVVVFAGSALVWGIELDPEARIPALAPEEVPAGAAQVLEVAPGSRVVAAGDATVADWGDLRNALLLAGPGPITLRLEDASAITLDLPANDTARAILVQALEPDRPALIGAVEENSPAKAAGLEAGDRVVSVNGEPVETWKELVTAVRARAGQSTEMVVERDGRTLAVTVTPEAQTFLTPEGGEEVGGRIGAGSITLRVKPGLVGAVGHGMRHSGELAAMIVRFLGDLLIGDASPRSLGGPILIGQISGQVVRLGLEPFLNFMALFSINLAVLNLLPIPVLDGGHLLFLGVEAIRGRALSFEQRMRFTQVGFVIVLGLMVWALANDVLRLFGL